MKFSKAASFTARNQKDSLAADILAYHFISQNSDMNRLVTPLLVLILAFCPGCLFSKKNPKPKENSAVAAETEQAFKQRFVDKRAGELTAQGLGAEAARAQALEEFKARYGYTGAAQK
jgi:hypothetical protein